MNIQDLFFFSLHCYDLGLFLKKYICLFKYRKWDAQTKRNVLLRQFKTSERCYICGNGPSLNKVNLDELDGDLIVMNDHWRLASKYKKRPSFYIINDDGYGHPSLLNRMDGVMNYYPEIPHVVTTQIGSVIDKRYSEIGTNVFYFNHVDKTFKHNYKIDFTKTTYCTWNVVSAAIQLAIYVGYKEICLLGCDYSLFASRYITHVYDKDGVKIERPFLLRDMLYKYTFTTHIHYEIAKYAQEHGIKVINMTSASLLDAYEMDLNSKY